MSNYTVHPLNVHHTPAKVFEDVWAEIVRDGKAAALFYDVESPGLDTFLTRISQSAVLGVWDERRQKYVFVAWFDPAGAWVWGHFVCLGKPRLEPAEMVLREVGAAGVRYCGGQIPEGNEKAMRYLKRLGYTRVGVLPEFAHTTQGRRGMVIFHRRLGD